MPPAPAAADRPSAPEFAVLVPLILKGDEDCVLLTKRQDSLPKYSGQVSFPGGARDPGDRDLFATAVRETNEEVGIAEERISLLSELPWHLTGLGHRVKPFLARVAPGPMVLNPDEVERLLYLPVTLARSDPFRVRGTWKDPAGKEHTVYTLEWDGLEIWGLTARILRDHFVEHP